MILEEIQKQKSENGIIYLSEIDKSFESLYLQVLKKEKRFYDIDEVKLLPYASQRNPYINEWALRTKSYLRFRDYLSKKTSALNILDLGCGNGWLSGQLAKEFNHNYFCVDVNLAELEQGAMLFKNDNIAFIHADILSSTLPVDTFNIVILNSALQYFPNVGDLMKEIFSISKSYGEVHIIDTPFYNSKEVLQEKNKTLKHFTSIGLPNMANKYFHHTFEELKYFRHQFLYNPDTLKNKLSSFIFEKDSPYPWILVTR